MKKHPYDLAFALTDYKLQGRTLPKLILSVCHRHRMPWMTLQSFYVLISRVTRMSGLRLLQHDETGLHNVLTLMPDKYLYSWERGYDTNGMWNKELAATALRNIRRTRDIEKQASATVMRQKTFIDNQRSPAKERPNEHQAPKRKGLHSISAGFVKRQATQHEIAQLKRDVIPPRQRWVLQQHGLHHLLLHKRFE